LKPSFQYSPHRGSVVLLALCFVAVLGISLASYLALSSRAMQLSNRTVKQGQAQQLAELGLEEGLRAMNLNLFSDADTTAALADWNSGGTSVNWSLDPTKKRARATMDFPVDKFGTGITATVKIRIDNYDAGSLDSLWNSSTTYRMGNLVGYNGNWYRGISNDNNKTPNALASAVYWVQENNAISSGMSWTLGTTYAQGNMVLRNSQWYRYTDAGSSTASTTNAPGTGASWSTYWTAVPQLISNNEYTTVFDNQSVLNYNNIKCAVVLARPGHGSVGDQSHSHLALERQLSIRCRKRRLLQPSLVSLPHYTREKNLEHCQLDDGRFTYLNRWFRQLAVEFKSYIQHR
jgi:hypothetical protein